MHTVFVYGTLKVGEKNHHCLERDGCRYTGKGRTTEKYPLVLGTRYNIPFVLFNPGTGHHIQGELYEVDDGGLEKLDELEMHPHLYERLVVDITRTDTSGGETVSAICYFLVKYRDHLLELPFHESYSQFKQGFELNLPTERIESENRKRTTKDLDFSEVHTEFSR